MPVSIRCVSLFLCVLGTASLVTAQTIESVGERAQGMGGAFVAVADDGSATWWNPAALAAGPFVDVGLGVSRKDQRVAGDGVGRERTISLSLTTPPFGVSYYRLCITDIQGGGPTVTPSGGREDGRGGVVRTLEVHDLGVTLLTSVFSGVHVGATFKFLRGGVEFTNSDPRLTGSALLDLGEDVDVGRSQGRFDLDLGVLAVTGPFRAGAVVKNVVEPEFDGGAGLDSMRLPRQARVGVAYDAALRQDAEASWVVSADVDVVRYTTGTGERRVIAAGAERWLFGERIGIRGGGRFNQVGNNERSATAGVSAAIRSGLLVEAHLVAGGADDERGWGLGARFSF